MDLADWSSHQWAQTLGWLQGPARNRSHVEADIKLALASRLTAATPLLRAASAEWRSPQELCWRTRAMVENYTHCALGLISLRSLAKAAGLGGAGDVLAGQDAQVLYGISRQGYRLLCQSRPCHWSTGTWFEIAVYAFTMNFWLANSRMQAWPLGRRREASNATWSFGANWLRMVSAQQTTDQVRWAGLEAASLHLHGFLNRRSLRNLAFLDVGCGAGYNSLAALQAGARRVVSVDVDEGSLQATRLLREWAAESTGLPVERWRVQYLDALDKSAFVGLGSFDVIYSYGVLHHTPAPFVALSNLLDIASPQRGILWIAVYPLDTKDPIKIWREKRRRIQLYRRGEAPMRRVWELEQAFVDLMYVATTGKDLRQYVFGVGDDSHHQQRGTDFLADTRDTLGGWPVNHLGARAIVDFVERRGFEVLKLRLFGNMEFLIWQPGPSSAAAPVAERRFCTAFAPKWGSIMQFLNDGRREGLASPVPPWVANASDDIPTLEGLQKGRTFNLFGARNVMLLQNGRVYGSPHGQGYHMERLLPCQTSIYGISHGSVVVFPAPASFRVGEDPRASDAEATHSWQLCRVPTDEFESVTSRFHRQARQAVAQLRVRRATRDKGGHKAAGALPQPCKSWSHAKQHCQTWHSIAIAMDGRPPSPDDAEARALQGELVELCQDLHCRPFMRDFCTVLQKFGQVLTLPAVPEEARKAARVAIDFLRPYADVERSLEFFLSNHTEEGLVRRFGQAVQRGLAAAQSEGVQDLGPELLQSWQDAVDRLEQKCHEIFELHFYSVFLEVKGDRALLDQTFRSLGGQLQLSRGSLLTCLERTRPWAEVALKVLAKRQKSRLLERLHASTLRSWRQIWQDTPRPPETGKLGAKFWDNNFIHLYKIAWPDLVEAFENFYLVGRCPMDLVRQLRLRVDPQFSHQVTKFAFQTLLKGHTRIADILDMLIDEVLRDISSCIYRSNPADDEVIDVDEVPPPARAPPRRSSRSEHQAVAERTRKASGSPGSSQLQVQPWVPFAHSPSDDADMAIPTPIDVRHPTGPGDRAREGPRRRRAWDEYASELCAMHRPWWNAAQDEVDHELRESALLTVDSCIAATRKALAFRVVSGDLGTDQPALALPGEGDEEKMQVGDPGSPRPGEAAADLHSLPALAVVANGTRFSGVTKFGRSSSRRTLVPDFPMLEAIASRSHFNVVHDQESDQFHIMDAGSKWGTFLKISSSVTLSCGDWIRVGGVEFIVRFCGGGCRCQKSHRHYRLHSLRLMTSRACRMSLSRLTPTFPEIPEEPASPRSDTCSMKKDDSAACPGVSRPVELRRTSVAEGTEDGTEDGSSDEELAEGRLESELMLTLSSRKPRGWLSTAARHSQEAACRPQEASAAQEVGIRQRWDSHRPGTCVPIAPLELDFISGPRMGEKIVLCERVCTLGRGEGNTIQVTDSQLTSVSRVHCIFEFSGNRWRMRDNSSTNGTWRRLSCVLEPSEAVPVHGPMSIQAGTHEFFVKPTEMRQCLIPSPGRSILEDANL
ncbi:cmoB [Symbiodinium natans]|uniref:CmoB protein n=1 Tax=Symbiodinium natans TaxID=878477 RepID=A0A812PZA3_9DINO|nr:cmoB [Symbiodinium natans]